MTTVDSGAAIDPRSEPPPAETVPPASADQSGRETVESIVVAIILAFLFRGVVAEAFVIPTGSMAPTLQGRHMDVTCSQCGYQYRTGASIENRDSGVARGEVVRTRCPICRFAMPLDKTHNPNHHSFNGDRILVSKFAYLVAEPRRWDVIVFKYPGDAKTPYIKRLVGLPGETIQIRQGDIAVLDPATAELPEHRRRFRIARKSPARVDSMLQLVDDSGHLSESLRRARWPTRWQPFSSGRSAEGWQVADDGREFQVAAGPQTSWLRYRHLIPRAEDWSRMERQEPLQLAGYQGQLITDYYAYNDSSPYSESTDAGGQCWVGDLAVEIDVEGADGRGELLLDLVEGGVHHRCSLDLDTGRAVVEIDGGRRPFVDAAGQRQSQRVAATSLRGRHEFQLRFANIDDELLLWVDGRHVPFDAPATFESPRVVVPRWSPADPGDLLPVGVGARQARLRVTRLKVLRDVYYRAVGPTEPYKDSEYDRSRVGYGFDIAAVLASPASWSTTPLFAARRSVTFSLDADQYFPLGDNSPESRDARLWSEPAFEPGTHYPPPYVTRDLLIGQAVFIYWPHSWRIGTPWLPVIPNFQRMGRIR